MQTVIIVIHLLVVIALVGTVLIQRSEGGGLGIGGGSGFMTARGTKNALTRLTAILAACFFLTSIILTVMQLVPAKDGSDIIHNLPQQQDNSHNLLDSLGEAKTDENKAGDNKGADAHAAGGAAPNNAASASAAQKAEALGAGGGKAGGEAEAGSAHGGKAENSAAPAGQQAAPVGAAPKQ